MTTRQAISILRRLKTPYNADAIELAVDALKAVPVMEKVNAELFERVRELERERGER